MSECLVVIKTQTKTKGQPCVSCRVEGHVGKATAPLDTRLLSRGREARQSSCEAATLQKRADSPNCYAFPCMPTPLCTHNTTPSSRVSPPSYLSTLRKHREKKKKKKPLLLPCRRHERLLHDSPSFALFLLPLFHARSIEQSNEDHHTTNHVAWRRGREKRPGAERGRAPLWRAGDGWGRCGSAGKWGAWKREGGREGGSEESDAGRSRKAKCRTDRHARCKEAPSKV